MHYRATEELLTPMRKTGWRYVNIEKFLIIVLSFPFVLLLSRSSSIPTRATAANPLW
jgi:hypothetical protein